MLMNGSSARAVDVGHAVSMRRIVMAALVVASIIGLVFIAPARAAATPPYVLVDSWESSDHRVVQLRVGQIDSSDRGFGQAKLTFHNLTATNARIATQHPNPGYPQKLSSTKDTWNYVTTVAHVVCKGWSIFRRCRIVEKVDIRVGVDFTPIDPQGNTKGIITGFCVGYQGRCPSWVRTAIPQT